jgi:hypothetical protein
MKISLSFLFVLLLFGAVPLRADIGSTIVYKAKFVLKNGSSFIGYLPISGYDVGLDSNGRNEHCSDKAFQLMLIKHFSLMGEKHLDVYDHIYLVHHGQKNYVFYIGCADKTKVNSLRISDLKYTVFLDAAYAAYDWYVYGIQLVDPSVIDIIRHQPPVNYEQLLINGEEGFGEYASFINFNPDISSSELYQLVAEVSRKIQIREDGTKFIPPSQVALLKEKNIIILYGHVGGC